MKNLNEEIKKDEGKNSGNKGLLIILGFWAIIIIVIILVKVLFL
jgi:hypothetical protein